ncbi:hypothetical protein KKC94_05260 [Patescibacteria group bacterium]|nr:hypothetical protein [Patescibacteria group bacterium]
MYTLYGIWVDHAHAFVVKTNKTGDMMEITKLSSSVPPHNHGGLDGDERLSITDQQTHMETRKNEMNKFCKAIIAQLKNPDEIVIFGPGTAKHDLKHHVEDVKALAPHLTKVETTDKLSESELKEKVRELLNLPRS